MLLQGGGRTNALRALLKAEQERGPYFLRLANALSALYPKGIEEKRLLDDRRRNRRIEHGGTESTEMDLNKITEQIVGAAIEVHKALGPGLSESAYEECPC